jgi:hypothetical protein
MINTILKGVVTYLSLFAVSSRALDRQESDSSSWQHRIVAADGVDSLITPRTIFEYEVPVNDKFGDCQSSKMQCNFSVNYEGLSGSEVVMRCPVGSIAEPKTENCDSNEVAGYFKKGNYQYNCSKTNCKSTMYQPKISFFNYGCSPFKDEKVCGNAILHNEPVLRVSCSKI